MFKKKCSRCERKLERDFLFCPYCSNDLRMEKKIEESRDYGFLGKDDFIMPSQKIDVSGFESMFNSIVKEFMSNTNFDDIEKQFKEFGMFNNKLQDKPQVRKTGISINVNMSSGKPVIKVQKLGEMPKQQMIKKRILSDDEANKIARLPKKEAKTEVRRLSNKLVYELDVPGVKNLNDVFFNNLENSIEIKAVADNKVYSKLIPIKMPLAGSKLVDGRLVLEFKTN